MDISSITAQEYEKPPHQFSLDSVHASISTLLVRLKPWMESCSVLSKKIKQVVETAKYSGERISCQVKVIDLEQERILSTIKAIQTIQDIRECAAIAQKAMKTENYEEAVAAVQRYLILTQEHPDVVKSVEDVEKRQDETPVQILQGILIELGDLAKKWFDQAVLLEDSVVLNRFFRIFPRISLGQYGLYRFAEHLTGNLRKKVDQQLKDETGSLTDNETRNNLSKAYCLVRLCIRLFEVVAKSIDENELFVEEIYGPGKMIYVISRLRHDIDKQAFKLLCIYLDQVHFERRVKDAKATLHYGNVSSTIGEDTATMNDRSDVDLLLSHLVLWNHHAKLYFKFMEFKSIHAINRLQKDINAADSDSIKKKTSTYHPLLTEVSSENGWRKSSEFYKKLEESMNDYLILEEKFAKDAVEKAISIDVYNEKESHDGISSSVDDIFYILKKCTFRALSSADVDTFCAMINLVLRILEVDYWSLLVRRITSEDSSPVYSITPLVCLNNMDMSCEYLLKLKSELEIEVAKLLSEESERNHAKIQTCLAEFVDATTQFRQYTIQDALHEFFRQYLYHHLRIQLENNLKDTHYLLSEDDYSDLEIHDSSLCRKFTADLQKFLLPIRKSLTSRNSEILMGLVVDFTLKEYERFILQAKFTALGAMQLDNDIRHLYAFLNSWLGSSSTLRDRFGRLQQISAILNVDHPSDVIELQQATSSSFLVWHLTHGQVRQLLTLRVDFKLEEIHRLKL
jgi:hypothetical protein